MYYFLFHFHFTRKYGFILFLETELSKLINKKKPYCNKNTDCMGVRGVEECLYKNELLRYGSVMT